ncbi:MAG: SsrA-binding protein SmpB [Alphaproteobacteria bacterium]|jgi:SsrA-binding protein|nr:SsrA-binding protein SmpB [Alphaproteobacteria bacterium]
MAKDKKHHNPHIVNRKAQHEYDILETIEVGIALQGSEVKPIRQGKVSINEAFARVERNGELWMYHMDIAAYENAPVTAHEPKRPRKLLAHRREIDRLMGLTSSAGTTLVPLELYFSQRRIVKIRLAAARGRRRSDKRQTMKRKEADRDMRRAMTRRKIG